MNLKQRLSTVLAVPLALLALGGCGDGSILPSAAAAAAPRFADAGKAAPAAGASAIQAPVEPRASSIEEPADATFMREAHSDGGYWYWLERQPAARGTEGR